MTDALTSEGLVSLLKESDTTLQIHALNELIKDIDKCWHVVADHIETIEALFEDENFSERNLAAFLASKVYYHLEEIGESLEYALNSGDFFSADEESEYAETLISQCIDNYIRIRNDPDCGDKLDPRLEQIVIGMLDRCLVAGFSRQALGIALESLRIDYVKKVILQENSSDDILSHAFNLSETTVQHKGFRTEVFGLLLEMYQEVLERLGNADYRNVCRCQYYLGNYTAVAKILGDLLESDVVMAYQLAFDLAEYEDTYFLGEVAALLMPSSKKEEETEASPDESGTAAETTEAAPDEKMTDAEEKPAQPQLSLDDPRIRLVRILNGAFADDLYLKILYNQSNHDFVILKNIKDVLPPNIGSLNMAAAAANALMCCGTTIDQFLRDNLKWLAKFRNFDKFLSIAFMGMIHKGHVQEGKSVLQAYLPPAEGPIAGGGALYALGLIHANNCDYDTSEYMFQQLLDSESNEILRHGAILGNALISIGTQDMRLFGEFQKILEAGVAVPGSGAGYGIGLLMAGTMNEAAINALKTYATEDTEKKSEKVIRGACVGLALCFFAQEERADDFILEAKSHRDAHVRYGACYAIGMAYACTASNRALRWLLDMAVSDVSDDVRRAATSNIGFVFANKPDQVPDLLRLLAKSFNPYVRYGSACAIAIACASTANKQAAKILKLLSEDNVEYVRQGAHIATGILYMQRNETECPEIKEVRESWSKVIGQKRRGDKMARMGAILGNGFMDAGGRNLSISMMTPTGQKRMKAILGMVLFWQHWEWYPLIPMVSLCFKPTVTIGLDEDLEMPKVEFTCNCKPSQFAYPEKLTEEKAKKKKIMKTAELSISAKAKARQLKKKKAKAALEGDAEMEDAEGADKNVEAGDEEKGEDAMEVEEGKAEEKKEEPEPESYVESLPCRVTRAQQEFVSLAPDSRYELVNDRTLTGFIMLRNKRPDEPKELVCLKQTDSAGVYGNEPEPPADFIYTGV